MTFNFEDFADPEPYDSESLVASAGDFTNFKFMRRFLGFGRNWSLIKPYTVSTVIVRVISCFQTHNMSNSIATEVFYDGPQFHKIEGITPTINDEALILTDHAHNIIYTFGGCRWKNDTNNFNLRPNSDFHSFDLLTLQWTNLTRKTLFEAVVEFPFAADLLPNSQNESSSTKPVSLKKVTATHKPITASLNPMGQIIHIERTNCSYLLLFGGQRVDPSGNLFCSNDMICVDLQTLKWRRIVLDGFRDVPGLVGGTMIVTGNHLYIFGGARQKLVNTTRGPAIDENDLLEISETYSVADLVTRKWIVQAKKMPYEIGSLGFEPNGITVDEGRKIILLRGRDGSLRAPFHSMFILNTETLDWVSRGLANPNQPMPGDVYQFEQFRGLDNNLSTADYAGILFVWSRPDDEDSDDEVQVENDRETVDGESGDEDFPDYHDKFRYFMDRDVKLHLAPTRNVSIWLFRYIAEENDNNQTWWISLCSSDEILGSDSKFRIGYCVNTAQQNVVILGFHIELDCKQNNLLRRSFNAYAVADGSPLERNECIESPPTTPESVLDSISVRKLEGSEGPSRSVDELEKDYDSDNFYE